MFSLLRLLSPLGCFAFLLVFALLGNTIAFCFIRLKVKSNKKFKNEQGPHQPQNKTASPFPNRIFISGCNHSLLLIIIIHIIIVNNYFPVATHLFNHQLALKSWQTGGKKQNKQDVNKITNTATTITTTVIFSQQSFFSFDISQSVSLSLGSSLLLSQMFLV